MLVAIFLASLVGCAIQLILNPFFSLYLAADDFAITGYFASFNSLLSPLISFSIVQYYARNFYLFNTHDRERLKNTLLVTLIIFSCCMALLSFIGLLIFFKTNNVKIPILPFGVLSVSGIFFNCFYSFMLVDLKMQRNARKFLVLSVINAVVTSFIAILFVIILRWGAYGKMLSTLISNVIFSVYVLAKMLSKWEFDKKMIVNMFWFSWPLTIASMLNYFFSGIDRAMLESLNEMKTLGLYNVAFQVTGYLGLFGTSLNSTFQPDVYESIANKNKKKTVRIILAIITMNLIPIMIFILFAHNILDILTFGRYTDATQYAQILSLSNVSSGIYFATTSILTGYGYSKIVLANKIVGSLLSVCLFVYLINNYGFIGAAWGQVLSFLLMAFIAVFFILYKMRKNVINKCLKHFTIQKVNNFIICLF